MRRLLCLHLRRELLMTNTFDAGLTDTCANCMRPIRLIEHRWRHDYPLYHGYLTCDWWLTFCHGLEATPGGAL